MTKVERKFRIMTVPLRVMSVVLSLAVAGCVSQPSATPTPATGRATTTQTRTVSGPHVPTATIVMTPQPSRGAASAPSNMPSQAESTAQEAFAAALNGDKVRIAALFTIEGQAMAEGIHGQVGALMWEPIASCLPADKVFAGDVSKITSKFDVACRALPRDSAYSAWIGMARQADGTWRSVGIDLGISD